MILPKREEPLTTMVGMPPEEGTEKPANRHQKHIIPINAILVNKELGAGEFGVVQQGVWTNDRERVRSRQSFSRSNDIQLITLFFMYFSSCVPLFVAKLNGK